VGRRFRREFASTLHVRRQRPRAVHRAGLRQLPLRSATPVTRGGSSWSSGRRTVMSTSGRLAPFSWILVASMLAGTVAVPSAFAQAVQRSIFDTPEGPELRHPRRGPNPDGDDLVKRRITATSWSCATAQAHPLRTASDRYSSPSLPFRLRSRGCATELPRAGDAPAAVVEARTMRVRTALALTAFASAVQAE